MSGIAYRSSDGVDFECSVINSCRSPCAQGNARLVLGTYYPRWLARDTTKVQVINRVCFMTCPYFVLKIMLCDRDGLINWIALKRNWLFTPGLSV